MLSGISRSWGFAALEFELDCIICCRLFDTLRATAFGKIPQLYGVWVVPVSVLNI